MPNTIHTQLAKINLGYEALIEEFIKRMLEYPGCWINVPMPIHKGQTIAAWNDEKQEICDRTAELLTMMGIKHLTSNFEYQMKVED